MRHHLPPLLLLGVRRWNFEEITRAAYLIRIEFGGIFNPPKGEAPPEAMVNLCPLCMGKVKRGNRTQHLMSVHKRTREDAKSLIEKYCGQ